MSLNERITLTRPEAAALCGLTPTGFDVWVRKGIVPTAIAGTRRWSRAALIAALSGQSVAAKDEELDPYEQWKRDNARSAQRH